MSKEQLFVKINRFSAWCLLVLVFLFIVSGYGITKQIIDPVLAKYLHEELLPIPLFLFFLLHVGISIRYAFIRWKLFKNRKTGDIYVLVTSLIILVFFLWLFFSK